MNYVFELIWSPEKVFQSPKMAKGSLKPGIYSVGYCLLCGEIDLMKEQRCECAVMPDLFHIWVSYTVFHFIVANLEFNFVEFSLQKESMSQSLTEQ